MLLPVAKLRDRFAHVVITVVPVLISYLTLQVPLHGSFSADRKLTLMWMTLQGAAHQRDRQRQQSLPSPVRRL
jgi:hypothetical protein